MRPHDVLFGGAGKCVHGLHAAVDEVVCRLGARVDDVVRDLAVALIVRTGPYLLDGLLLGEVVVVFEMLFALSHPCARGVGVRGFTETACRVECDDP